MAYLTCPDCMMPNPVSDDAPAYACYSCSARIVFDRCPDCGFTQAIPERWQTAFACGACGERVVIPRRRSYATSTKARTVEGYGYMYPRT
jgi:ribosomal protein S27E